MSTVLLSANCKSQLCETGLTLEADMTDSVQNVETVGWLLHQSHRSEIDLIEIKFFLSLTRAINACYRAGQKLHHLAQSLCCLLFRRYRKGQECNKILLNYFIVCIFYLYGRQFTFQQGSNPKAKATQEWLENMFDCFPLYSTTYKWCLFLQHQQVIFLVRLLIKYINHLIHLM